MKDIQSKLSEDASIAILQANAGGRKKKAVSPVLMAEAARVLYDKYKSYDKVARLVKVISGEMVREFYDISTLPKAAKDLIDQGKIRIDVARRLPSVGNDAKRQTETAEAIAGLTSHVARHVIDSVVRNPDKTPAECRDIVLGSKNTVRALDTLVFSLESEEFKLLNQLARKQGITTNKLVKQIIKDWIASQLEGQKRA